MKKHQEWSVDSWKKFPAKQQPNYPDEGQLDEILSKVGAYPPLVFSGEIESLKSQLAEASEGRRFLLQGGDCAERFVDCNTESITRKLKIILQMSVVLCYGARKPVIRVGRIAGQFAKPRSNDQETVDGQEIPVFRGDNINSFDPDPEARKPDPQRLLKSYHTSALTLNYIRALTKGGFADLHHPHNWDVDFISNGDKNPKYLEIVDNIQSAITFMESLGTREQNLKGVEFYTSHEGLMLPYEEAQTKYDPIQGGYYNLGAHFLWIGDRTRQLDGAHVEYFRGIQNPIGLKVGPSASPPDILALVKALNPHNEPGRITLISRFGEGTVANHLPDFIEAMQSDNQKVLWSVDPMHGNAIKTKNNIKTRDFNAILSEIKESAAVHRQAGSHLGGVHFELTGDDVTECIGGAANITREQLSQNYQSYCDPRLNYSQSLEMAFLLSSILSPE